MTVHALFLLHLLVLGGPPLLFARFRRPFRLIISCSWFAILWFISNTIGTWYSLPITEGISISAGNIAFAASMMTAVILFITERDVIILRNMARLIALLTGFFLVLSRLVHSALARPEIIIPFVIPSALYEQSARIVAVGSLLMILELFALLLVFEGLKRSIRNVPLLSVLSLLGFILVLALDGILFPLLAFPLAPGFTSMIRGSVPGKLLVGIAFSIGIGVHFLIRRSTLYRYLDEPLDLDALLKRSREELVEELKRKTRELEESEALFRSLAENSHDCIARYDRECRHRYVNPALLHLSGLGMRDFLGRSLRDMPAPDAHYRHWMNEVLQVFATGTSRNAVIEWDDFGEKRYLDSRMIPEIDKHRTVQTVLVISRDIAELKRNEERLRSALNEKEVLLRELYHRTKNNMQVISSMLNLQAMYSGKEEIRNIVRELENKIQAMALVHQMLYQSQNLSQLNLRSYLSELTSLIMGSFRSPQRGISLFFDLEDVVVSIETALSIGLILNELMSNALKYAFPGERKGTITVRLARVDERQVRLQVSDDGVGLPGGFDSRTVHTLGLRTITAIGEHQMQGSVEFRNDPGVSCTVTFPSLREAAGTERE